MSDTYPTAESARPGGIGGGTVTLSGDPSTSRLMSPTAPSSPRAGAKTTSTSTSGDDSYRSSSEDEVSINLDFGGPSSEAAEARGLRDRPGLRRCPRAGRRRGPRVESTRHDAGAEALEAFRSELRRKPGEWYVVHTYSGMENRVLQNLENRVSSLNMEDYIYEIIVPTEEVTEIRNGQRKQVKRTVLPGYVLVRMDLTDESWSTVRHTPSVTGFVGHSNQPVPLSLRRGREDAGSGCCRGGDRDQRGPDSPAQEGRGRRLRGGRFRHGRRRPVRRCARHDHRDQRQQPAAESAGRNSRTRDSRSISPLRRSRRSDRPAPHIDRVRSTQS